MNKENANAHFPLYKYTYEEHVYGRDGGSEWADPENDIRRGQNLKYWKKENVDSQWVEIYSEGCGHVEYAASQAVITLEKLRNVCEPGDDVCMFSHGDTMFKRSTYCEDQKAICGEAIDAHYYNEYEDDTSTKRDLLGSFVNFYKTDELAISNGRIYLNGELRLDRKQLKELGIEYHQVVNMYPKEVEDKIKELFPEATEYNSWCGWGKLKR